MADGGDPPASTIRRIAASPPVSSGARVTIRIARGPRRAPGRSRPGPGRAARRLVGAAPVRRTATGPPGGCRRSGRPDLLGQHARPAGSNSAGCAVTSEAIMVVVPCRRCSSTAACGAAPVASGKAPPPPPCTCMSTNPGTTVAAPRSQVGRRGRRPGADAGDPAVGDLDPARAEHLASGDDGVGGDQHVLGSSRSAGGYVGISRASSDALPGRLGP